MAEWHQFLQSILIGLIFSYLLAKLISIVVSFKDDNLSITRRSHSDETSRDTLDSTIQEADSVIAEHGSVWNESRVCSDVDDDDDDDDDWEGVESTELDEEFSAATAFVAASAVDRGKVPTEVQLQLYGLYKIATEGPCSTPQPSALKMTARAKWQVWQKLGAMPPEDAMQQYIDIVTEFYPTWAAGSALKKDGRGDITSSDSKGPMGPVFSSFVYEEDSGNELKMDAIHAFAREGDVNNLLECIESGVSVNLKDSEGRTPLHWAVDRGHFNIVEVLSNKNADINSKDDDGQTPLHYAVVCERESIAEFLVKQNAVTDVKDSDGNTAIDLCEFDWPCLRPVAT